MTRVLVIGGTGIIGTHVCRGVLSTGAQVLCLSRRGIAPVEHDRLKNIRGDAARFDDVHELQGMFFDAVIDLVSFNAHQVQNTVTTLGPRIAQYIVISSATVYKSGSSGVISEQSEHVSGGWHYPLEKIRLERSLATIGKEQPWFYTVVQPYITYSEKRLPAAEFELPDIAKRIASGCALPIGNEMLRAETTVTHASDVAQGIVGLIGNTKAVNQTFIITSEESHSWRDVINELGKQLEREPIYAPVGIDDVLRSFPQLAGKIGDRLSNHRFDTSKLKLAVPSFSCQYDLSRGFASTFPQPIPRSNVMTQAVMDRLVSKCGRKEYRPAIKACRRQSFAENGCRERLKYAIHYYPVLRRSATAALRLLRPVRGVANPYA